MSEISSLLADGGQCLQMVVSICETRQEELLQQNKRLQAALVDSQSDHCFASNLCQNQVQCLQMVVSSYETRQRELMQENKGLQAALADLQSDYRALANKQAAAQQLHAAAVGNLVEEEEVQAGLPGLDPSQLQRDLSLRMAAMKKRIAAVYDGPLQEVNIQHSEYIYLACL